MEVVFYKLGNILALILFSCEKFTNKKVAAHSDNGGEGGLRGIRSKGGWGEKKRRQRRDREERRDAEVPEG